MSIQAAYVAPSFTHRRRLVAEDLMRLDDAAVILEHVGTDSDNVEFYVFTIGGVLDGEVLPEGCTVGGEVIVIHADSREAAKQIAVMGLEDTINALEREDAQRLDALAALARLDSVGAAARLEAAIKPDADKSDAFVSDIEAIQPLIGEDISLASGTRPTDVH